MNNRKSIKILIEKAKKNNNNELNAIDWLIASFPIAIAHLLHNRWTIQCLSQRNYHFQHDYRFFTKLSTLTHRTVCGTRWKIHNLLTCMGDICTCCYFKQTYTIHYTQARMDGARGAHRINLFKLQIDLSRKENGDTLPFWLLLLDGSLLFRNTSTVRAKDFL